MKIFSNLQIHSLKFLKSIGDFESGILKFKSQNQTNISEKLDYFINKTFLHDDSLCFKASLNIETQSFCKKQFIFNDIYLT